MTTAILASADIYVHTSGEGYVHEITRVDALVVELYAHVAAAGSGSTAALLLGVHMLCCVCACDHISTVHVANLSLLRPRKHLLGTKIDS